MKQNVQPIYAIASMTISNFRLFSLFTSLRLREKPAYPKEVHSRPIA